MIYIGSDHGGFQLKLVLKEYLQTENIPFYDCGCNGETVDYPDIANILSLKVTENPDNKGVLICGTGIGVSIAANKVAGIRAALCGDSYSAKYTRLHNDANVLCLGGRVIGSGLAVEILDIFLKTEFEGGRHALRIAKFR